MSNEAAIDWFARNVHEWPSRDEVAHCWPPSGIGLPEYILLSKDQWLARRAELQNKPSWGDWPQRKYMAQGKNGCWIVSDRELTAGDDGRWHYDKSATGGVTSRGVGEVLGDWRYTLEKRPEYTKACADGEWTSPVAAEFQPITSIEDNQELNMTQQQEVKQDNGWFERGDLPPEGVECEAYVDGRWSKCYVVGFSRLGVPVIECNGSITDVNRCKFRPIRTERDVLIDAIASQGLMNEYGDLCVRIADSVIAAGFKMDPK